MSPLLLTQLQRQANHELLAAQSYLAMAFWCDVHHHGGYAAFFHKQAAEEQSHARKILQHLVDRDIVPVLGALNAPTVAFDNLVEVAEAAYHFERANTAGIHSAYETALAEKDYPAQVMLHWFINEQVEEEAWSDKMLVKTREATCAGATLNLDRHLSKILSGTSE
jgi:ferritin